MIKLLKRAEREPAPPAPLLISPEATRRLGTIRGRAWLEFQGAEFELLDAAPIADAGPGRLADGQPYIEDAIAPREEGGSPERVWRPLRRHPPGTFANGGRAPASPASRKRPKPMRSVDGLALLPALAPRREEIISFAPPAAEPIFQLGPESLMPGAVIPAARLPRSPGAVLTGGERPGRGVPAIMGILNKVGVTLEPDRYACHLDARSEGGGLAEGGRELLEKVTPLLAATLGAISPPPPVDGPLRCHGKAHTGDAPLAVTLGPCGMPLCAGCTQ